LFTLQGVSLIFLLRHQEDLATSNVYQAIFEANLDGRLEELLVNLLRYNSSADVQEPIRIFLYNYQIMSDNFWAMYKKAKTYEDVLGCYYQFSKNQCTVIETLLENLKLTLEDYSLKEDLQLMLKSGFTF
jgi:hypothetical protein